MNVSGTKAELIDRIIKFYDNLLEREEDLSDPRELWYSYFSEFAWRNAGALRGQQIIEKDIELERKFEEATKYLFEKLLLHKPLTLVGSNHPDGAVSYQDALIYWDNKSKESAVNLKDHIKQFDGYIKTSDKRVAAFLVIGPDFTQDSAPIAMQYQVENGTTITMITADELKSLAQDWVSKQNGKDSNRAIPTRVEVCLAASRILLTR